MEENNTVMNEEINEVPVEETDVDSVSSGNSFNKGLAAVGVAAAVGVVVLIRKLVKNHKAKKAAAEDGGDAPAEEKPKSKKKVFHIGKDTEITIDKRDRKKENSDEENDEE